MKINEKYKTLFEQPKDIRYYIVTGGRGSAKSFSVALYSCLKTYEKDVRILYTRYTLTSAGISIIPEFTEKLELLNIHDNFNVTKSEIINNGTNSDILFRGLKTSSGNQTANLKSIQGVSVWILDEAEELHDEKMFDKIDFSIRSKTSQNIVILVLNPAEKEHWVYKRFFESKGIESGFNGVADNVCYIHTSYLDNIDNLSESFIKNVEQVKELDYDKYRHIFLGEWIEEPEGVLFSKKDLNFFNSNDIKEYDSTLAYIDVADTGKDSHCVIIGQLKDNKVYITDVLYTTESTDTNVGKSGDILNKYNPEWCRIESNMGGNMYRNLLDNVVNSSVQLLPIRNTTNKHTRIMTLSGFVKSFFVFRNDYELNSDYDLFMKNFTNYLKDGSSKHDDAPDSVQGLAKMYRTFYAHIWSTFFVDGKD